MPKLELDRIKGGNSIVKHGDYVAVFWKALWLFKCDKTLVFHRKDISYVEKVVFLNENRLLVAARKAYYLLNLVDGSDIWVIPRAKNIETAARRFAVAPDHSLVYDYYCWNDRITIVRIDIAQGTTFCYQLREGLRATVDLICDEQGIPCVLQTQSEKIGDELVSQNGILYQHQDAIQPGSVFHWKYKWTLQRWQVAKGFLGSTERILTKNMCIYEPATGAIHHAFENDKDYVFSKTDACGAPIYTMDETGAHLTLAFREFNLVIDLAARKIVGRYAGRFTKGCIVNNEYWISSESGIRRLPFPLIEEIDPRILYRDWTPVF